MFESILKQASKIVELCSCYIRAYLRTCLGLSEAQNKASCLKVGEGMAFGSVEPRRKINSCRCMEVTFSIFVPSIVNVSICSHKMKIQHISFMVIGP